MILVFVSCMLFMCYLNCFAHIPEYSNDNKVRVWQPLMTNLVQDRLDNFLYSNNITNCYDFLEDYNHLLLKCWTNKDLVDVSILVKNKYEFLEIESNLDSNIISC